MPRPELSTLRYPHLWQGCVGAWCPSQSGATGYRLFDDSGNNNHGVLTNAGPNNWTPDEQKLSINYTGSAASSRMPATPVLNLTGPLTVCTWLKFSSGQGGRGIVAKSGDATQYHLSTGSADNRTLNFAIRSGATNYSVVTNRIYNDNSWHFVAGVYDKNNVIINIDGGREIVVGPSVTGDIDLTNPALFIGCFNNGGGSFVGLVDDTRVYNRALAPYEIRQLALYRGAAYERSRGRKKAYIPGYRITAPSRIQTGSARTVDGTDTESLSRGLVGAWCPSLGASGYRLIDRSGYGNHGTLTNMDAGTAWIPSSGKTSIAFTANSTNRIEVPDRGFFNSITQFSFSAWFNLRAYIGSLAGNAIFSRGQLSTFINDINLMIDTSGTMFAQVNNGADGSSSFNMTTKYTLGTWAHATLVYNGNGATNNDRVKIYLNGESQSLSHSFTTPSSTSTVTSNVTFRLGQYLNTINANEWCFNGFLDDIRIYNRALTPSEIRLLYTGGRGVGLAPEVKPKRARIVAWDNQDKISVPARVLTNTDSLKRGLVGHWSPSVSGPQGNRLMDLSGQNNHGTLTNMDYPTDYVPSAEKGGRMALDFNGADDYVDLASSPNYSKSPISFFLWYNSRILPPNPSLSYNYCLISNSQVSIPYNGFDFRGGRYRTGLDDIEFQTTISGTERFLTAGSLVINTWTQIGATYDGSVLRTYRNGVQVGSLSVSGSIDASSANLRIGDNPSFSPRFFNGQLDDIRIYNRALTPSEIRLLAQSRMPERATPQRTRTVFYSSGLISYLRRRSYNSILGSGVLS